MTGSDFEELEGEGRSVLLNFNITYKELKRYTVADRAVFFVGG